MKTAEQFFEDWCTRKGYVSIDQADDIEECMKEYAIEVVKKDRKNVADKAHICLRSYRDPSQVIENDYGEEVTTEREDEYYGVYADSIINAPLPVLK